MKTIEAGHSYVGESTVPEVKVAPPPQILSATPIESQEAVLDQKPLPLTTDPEYIRLVTALTKHEFSLQKKENTNIKRKLKILNKINNIRKTLNMRQMSLKDFI